MADDSGDGAMVDVFVAHGPEDDNLAEALIAVLNERTGWAVAGGAMPFEGELSEQVTQLESPRCVLVIWSAATVDSRELWLAAAFGQVRGTLVSVSVDSCAPPQEFEDGPLADITGPSVSDAELGVLLPLLSAILGEPHLPTDELPSTAAPVPGPPPVMDSLPEALRKQLIARAAVRRKGLLTGPTGKPRPEVHLEKLKQPGSWPSGGAFGGGGAPQKTAKGRGGRLWLYGLLAGGLLLAAWLGFKLLPLVLGSTSVARSREPAGGGPDPAFPADCSIYAPATLAAGGEIILQVFLHPPELAGEAERNAGRFDEDAEWRGATSLSLDLPKGTRVAVQLECRDLQISDDGCAEIRWSNRVTGVSFLVGAGADLAPGKRLCSARLLVEGVPAGRIHFRLDVLAEQSEQRPAEPLGDDAHRYRKAFISYSSEDRAEVLKRVQTLGALQIEYFQDVLSLEPGERWERSLYKQIDDCDLFLLFWSSAARDSQWVRREYQYARQRHDQPGSDEPDIIPILIEGPPAPAPWPECAHMHFNDRLLYVMRWEERSGGR